MINGENFDQPMKNDLKRHDNIKKIATGQGDECTTDFLLGYIYKMIAIYLRKQEALHADAKAIQQISFTGNLQNNSTILSINEEAKEIISQGTVIAFYFCFNIK